MATEVTTWDFVERLEWSADLSDEPEWAAFYQRVWPDMLRAVRVDKDGLEQRAGIDREIILPDFRRILIDEKKRQTAFRDIALEEWSVCGGFDRKARMVVRPKTRGWAWDPKKRCDYVAYAVPLLRVCYLLPYDLLRLTFARRIDEWRRTCSYPIVAHNRGYDTVSVGVAWPVLKAALTAEMQRDFSGDLRLPVMRAVKTERTLDLRFWGEATAGGGA